MVKATLTDDMIKLLSSTIGKHLVSYECEQDDGFSRTFGNIRINFEGLSIEITNEEHTLPFFGEKEDMTYFMCTEVDPSSHFVPAIITETKVRNVGKTVSSIEIISDSVSVNNGEYEITFDEAIVFHMGEDVLMLARDIWFSEIISIADNDDYDHIFSIEELKDAWSNDGEDEVKIQRSRIALS